MCIKKLDYNWSSVTIHCLKLTSSSHHVSRKNNVKVLLFTSRMDFDTHTPLDNLHEHGLNKRSFHLNVLTMLVTEYYENLIYTSCDLTCSFHLNQNRKPFFKDTSFCQFCVLNWQSGFGKKMKV